MAETNPDPFAMWRDWVAQSERQWNGFLNNAMATDEFSKGMGQFMDVYLNIQKSMNDVMGRYFTSINIPTRADLLQVADRMGGMEERLSAIESGIGALLKAASATNMPAASAAAAATPRPARTRKPASAAGAAPVSAAKRPARTRKPAKA